MIGDLDSIKSDSSNFQSIKDKDNSYAINLTVSHTRAAYNVNPDSMDEILETDK